MQSDTCGHFESLLERDVPAKRAKHEDVGLCGEVLGRAAPALSEDYHTNLGVGRVPRASKTNDHYDCRSSSLSSTMKTATTSSSSYSSRSLSPVSPHTLSIPLHILSRIQSGNNSHVFLARRVSGSEFALAEEREAAPREKRHISPSPPPQCREADWNGIDAGSAMTVDDTSMAVKFVSPSSRHMRREIFCLRYLDTFHGGEKVEAHDEVNEIINDDQFTATLFTSVRSLPPPSPKLLFTQELGRYVAIGLELLGPDLFAFTEQFILHEEELCLVGIELLRTLSAIHQRGVTHRSVKPENFCWNSKEILNNNLNKNSVRHDTNGIPNTVEYPFFFMFKIIDYGRSSVSSGASASMSPLYERPYRGWWHSRRGFLGKPMEQKDDLMGVVHTIGYLLDDYGSNEGTSSVSSRLPSAKRTDSSQCDLTTTTTTASTVTTPSFLAGKLSAEASAAANCCNEKNGSSRQQSVRSEAHDSPSSGTVSGDENVSRSHRRSYSSWRRQFADRVAIAYEAASKKYRQLFGRKQKKGETCVQKKKFSRLEPNSLNAVDRRNAKRAWIVCHVETEYLPAILPDNYYPTSMPQWWVEWFAACNAWCGDDTVTAAEMTVWMMKGLQRQIEKMGETVENLRHTLQNLYVRYHEGEKVS
ncbi:transferase [Trypanosoma rangeli]|uniref:Transferase n=1 Tax=Trypanosoma rangeli TaxID=5698 RepID=A0A422NI21_TRYRA|nr:transferase [Trypanosoma rangeli]RNF05115.1 transferase [Trypanosoma rangeli]|eukprot:RNF05115.1 transferase [Trypanosoma rangeli]